MKRVVFLAACLVLVLGFIFATSQFRQQRAERLGFMAQEQASTFVRPHSPVKGADDARVYIVKFTDPACETCAAFSPVVDRLMATYPGKIKLVVRHAPFHDGAGNVARVLEAARLQGRFCETLDLLYGTQNIWTRHHQVLFDQVWQLLPRAGLDTQRLVKEMRTAEVAAVIDQDLADAQTLGVRKTPGFFVNGKPLDPFGLEPFLALVEAEVRAQYPD